MKAYAGLTSSHRKLDLQSSSKWKLEISSQFPWDVFQDADEPPAVVEPEEAEVKGWQSDRWSSKSSHHHPDVRTSYFMYSRRNSSALQYYMP